MQGSFTKGLIVGSLIGATVAMMNPEMMKNRTRKRMIRGSRMFFRKSGNIINDVVDMFR
jgi:hypothetical protein